MKTKPYKAKSLTGAQAAVRSLRKQRAEMLRNWTRDARCALMLRAIVLGVARWEFFSGSNHAGEVCVGGMRYTTHIMANGCPEINDVIERALYSAINAKRKGEA